MSQPPRNAPCLCGSGRKFKKCCLPTATTPEEEQVVAELLPAFEDAMVQIVATANVLLAQGSSRQSVAGSLLLAAASITVQHDLFSKQDLHRLLDTAWNEATKDRRNRAS